MARAARRDPSPHELDARLTKVERQVTEHRDEVRRGFEAVAKRFDAVDARFAQVDKRFDAVDTAIREAKDSNDMIFKVLLRQREDDRALADQRQALADQRHAEIMAQFEKLLAKPSEN